MPEKKDPDSKPGIKLLQVFRKLLLNDRKYYQSDLAREFCCSPQTIIRIMEVIESVIGINLQSGLDNRRKWYRISSPKPKIPGLEFEELRYLSVCRDLAAQTLPETILARVDDTIFNLSLRMSAGDTQHLQVRGEPIITFFTKGRIDYSSKFAFIEKLLCAIEKRKVCRISYLALGREEAREHLFLPNRLVGMNHAFYALGAILSEDCAEVRHFVNFAVHRLQNVELTEKSAAVDFPEISSEEFGLPWHEPREFAIRFQPGKVAGYIAERTWSENQSIEILPDGGLILRLTSCSEPELKAWVRSFGDQAELLPPE